MATQAGLVVPSKFPRMLTERLLLREVEEADAEAVYGICSRPQYLAYWGAPVHESLRDSLAYIRAAREGFRNGLQLRWGYCARGTDRVIGMVGFYRFSNQHYRAELTYEQHPDCAGKGYMTEALQAAVEYGFATLGLHSMEVGIDPENAASLRVAERVGFKEEGFLRENYYFDGKFYDTILMSLHKPRPALEFGLRLWPAVQCSPEPDWAQAGAH